MGGNGEVGCGMGGVAQTGARVDVLSGALNNLIFRRRHCFN